MDIEEHRRLGGRTEVDVSYQYLTYFLEDDEELKRIHDEYETGKMLTGELKKIAIREIWDYIGKFQQRRSKITDQELNTFMDGTRPLRMGKRYNWKNEVHPYNIALMKKNFAPHEPKFSMFPDDLIVSIMTYLPLDRKKHLLYQNGEIDPRYAELEVRLYEEAAKTPALYIGYFKDDQSCIENFKDADEGAKRVADLKESNNGLEVVVVDGLKK